MVELPSIPEPHQLSDYIADGVRITAILVVWSVIAAFFVYGVGEIGGPESLFETLGLQVGAIIAFAGVLNALLYILYRAIDYWHQYPTS